MTDTAPGPTTATSEDLAGADALRLLYVDDGSSLRERTRAALERADERAHERYEAAIGELLSPGTDRDRVASVSAHPPTSVGRRPDTRDTSGCDPLSTAPSTAR